MDCHSPRAPGLGMPPEEIKAYILQVIDIIVQLKRGEKGVRFVSEIKFKAFVDVF